MRKLTYTNPRTGTSIELGSTAYPVTSLEGLSTPGVDQQTQKAPFQDGSNYIDSLLNDREIVAEGAINAPKDLTELNTKRRTMLEVLNPKDGPGTLVYTYDGGVKQITALPEIVFSNKEGTDPYVRWQLRLTAHSPFWENVTATTVAIPKANSDSLYNTVISSTAGAVHVIKRPNGDLSQVYESAGVIAYKNSTDQGNSWGSPVTIASGGGSFHRPFLLSLGASNLVCYYTFNSGTALSLRYKYSQNNGATWSTEASIGLLTPYGYSAVVDTSDNSVFVFSGYTPTVGQNDFVCYRSTNGGLTSYSLYSTLASNFTPTIATGGAQYISDKMIVTCVDSVDNKPTVFFGKRSTTFSFGSKQKYNIFAWNAKPLILSSTWMMVFIRSTAATYFGLIDYDSKELKPIVQSQFISDGTASVNPYWDQYSNGPIYDSSTSFYYYGVVPTNNNVRIMKQNIPTPVTITNNSDVDIPVNISVLAPVDGMIVFNKTTGEAIGVSNSPALLDAPVEVLIDTIPTQKSINIDRIAGSGLTENAINRITLGSKFIQLAPGENEIFGLNSYKSGAVTLGNWNLTYRERYIGV
jgi:hypothetical protein